MRAFLLPLALVLAGCAGHGDEAASGDAASTGGDPTPVADEQIEAIDAAAQDAADRIEPDNADAELDALKRELQGGR